MLLFFATEIYPRETARTNYFSASPLVFQITLYHIIFIYAIAYIRFNKKHVFFPYFANKKKTDTASVCKISGKIEESAFRGGF